MWTCLVSGLGICCLQPTVQESWVCHHMKIITTRSGQGNLPGKRRNADVVRAGSWYLKWGKQTLGHLSNSCTKSNGCLISVLDVLERGLQCTSEWCMCIIILERAEGGRKSELQTLWMGGISLLRFGGFVFSFAVIVWKKGVRKAGNSWTPEVICRRGSAKIICCQLRKVRR